MFGKNRARKDGLQTRCKVCDNIKNTKYYHDNKAVQLPKSIERGKKTRQRIKRKLHSIKASIGCIVCGECEPACLDMHHLDESLKSGDIGKMAFNTKWSKVEEEMKKCVVLCANCHRKLHAGLIQLNGNLSSPVMVAD